MASGTTAAEPRRGFRRGRGREPAQNSRIYGPGRGMAIFARAEESALTCEKPSPALRDERREPGVLTLGELSDQLQSRLSADGTFS